MGKMSQEQVIAFAKEFAEKLWGVDSELTDDVMVSTSEITVFLDDPENWIHYDEPLEEIIPRVAEDEEIEAVLFCEGDLWEMIYYCEAYGSSDETTNAVYKAFVKTVAKHGMWYAWGSGTVFLYKAVYKGGAQYEITGI